MTEEPEPVQFEFGGGIAEQTAEAELTRDVISKQQAAQDYLIESPGDWIRELTRPDYDTPATKGKAYNRDFTITNISPLQFKQCKIYGVLVHFCNNHKIDPGQHWFVMRREDILVLTRSVGGFERKSMISSIINFFRSQATQPEKKWKGIKGIGGRS